MERYYYLILDLACLLIPFGFSFYPKYNFGAKWKLLIPAIGLPAIVFIVWDFIFTEIGVWPCNCSYYGAGFRLARARCVA